MNYKEEAIIRLKECIADCTSGEDDIYKSAFATAILALRKQIPTKVRTKKCEDCEKEDCGMVAPDKKTLKKSVKSMFFMVQTRCEVETIKY